MTFNELKILDFTLSLPWWLGYVIIKVPLNRKHEERKEDRLDGLKKELRGNTCTCDEDRGFDVLLTF